MIIINIFFPTKYIYIFLVWWCDVFAVLHLCSASAVKDLNEHLSQYHPDIIYFLCQASTSWKTLPNLSTTSANQVVWRTRAWMTKSCLTALWSVWLHLLCLSFPSLCQVRLDLLQTFLEAEMIKLKYIYITISWLSRFPPTNEPITVNIIVS